MELLSNIDITSYIVPLLIVLAVIIIFKGIRKLLGALFAWVIISVLFMAIEYSTGYSVSSWVPTVIWAIWFFVFR